MPTCRFICLIVLVVCASAGGGMAQQAAPSFERLTVDDGLPDNSVRAILQDRLGFLWFGTHNGLVRYDGHAMVPFGPRNPESGAPVGLAAITLFEDRDGDLWIGTFAQGLWRLDLETGASEQWGPGSPPQRQLGGLHVTSICQGPDGTIWTALGEGGLAAVDPRDGSVRQVPGRPEDTASGPPGRPLSTVLFDRSDRMWVASEGAGLAYRPADGTRWRHLRHDPADPGSLPSDLVTHVHEDAQGRIWVTTRLGLALWDPASDRFSTAIPYPDDRESASNYLVRCDHDPAGMLWIGAAVGLYRFEPDSGRFQHFTHDPERDDTPLRGPVLSIHCDSAGIVWGGTWQAGLNKHDPLASRFASLSHDPEDPASLDFETVQEVFEDSRGVLWVGTGDRSGTLGRGGLNSRAPGQSGFDHHFFPTADQLQPGTVFTFAEDRDGTLWIGTDRGLWQLPRGQEQPQRTPAAAAAGAPLHDLAIQDLAIGPRGRIWIGTYGRGLHVLDPETGTVDRYLPDPDDPNSLPQINPIRVYRDRRDRMWIGMDTRGLALYDPAIDGFSPRFDPERGLTSPQVITEDRRGQLWLGAHGGLIQLDDDGQVVRTLTSHDGLPNDMVASVLEDDAGRLWLSTGRGFARVDPESGEIKTYDTRDGLPTNEAHAAHCRGSDGTLYFGGPRGLVSFDPAEVRDSAYVPPVVVTELRVADEPLHAGPGSPLAVPVERAAEVVLRHDQNDLTLSFAALHFARPERNRYRFRLTGVNDDWREPGEAPRAFYTNLSPGDYRFEVQGSNADGLWNPEPAVLAVRILPPWYRTAWAYAVYLVLTLGVAMLIYRQLIQRERMRTALEVERAEARHLQELDGLRSRFFANISHEFRTPLTLLQGLLQRLEREPESGDAALFAMMTRNARRLGQLIDQLLDLSRLEAGRLPLRWRHDDATAYLRALVSPFATLAEDRDVTFTADLPTDTSPVWFDADVLEKVVGNLLANALKFEPTGGAVRVTGTLADAATRAVPRTPGAPEPAAHRPARLLRVAVANSGSYIAPAEQVNVFDRFHRLAGASQTGGTGIGLALVKELVTLQGGTVELASDRDRGTCFTVELPLFLEPPPGGVLEDGADDLRDAEDTDDLGVAAPGAVTADAARAEVGPGDATGVVAPERAAPSVLVVEDNADLRSYVLAELAETYRLLEAADGVQGLAVATEQIPDLVVSDVMMPGMDGLELCRRLKDDLRTSHVPVILLTARAELESRLEGLQQGADDYLAKPFDARELRARIANLVASRRRLQERYAQQIRTLEPEAMPVTSADERFLRRCREVIDEHLDDEDFSVEVFARQVGLSRAQLHRKLKALLDMAPRDLLRSHRLQRAARLLEGRYGNVTEVAYAVGFKSLSHFARSFRDQFGVPPSEYPGDASNSP